MQGGQLAWPCWPWYCPVPHPVQTAAPAAEMLPAAHSPQDRSPVLAVNFPAVHVLHPGTPAVPEEPAGHRAHPLLAALDVEPGLHAVQTDALLAE